VTFEVVLAPAPALDDARGPETHIVKRADGDPRPAPAVVTDSIVFGREVEALCGYVWVPSRDPQRYPLCSGCSELWENLKARGAVPNDREVFDVLS
jgi:hypothetical protein